MATGSVATSKWNPDQLACKCEQVAGVLAVIAQSEASQEEIKNAVWGALALAHEAQDMAISLTGESAGEA